MLKTGLAAVNAASGAVDTAFDNNLTGGIGVNGALGVPQLKLTHDNSKLLVVHTGRQIDGQDRLGMGIIDTATKELLPVPQHACGTRTSAASAASPASTAPTSRPTTPTSS